MATTSTADGSDNFSVKDHTHTYTAGSITVGSTRGSVWMYWDAPGNSFGQDIKTYLAIDGAGNAGTAGLVVDASAGSFRVLNGKATASIDGDSYFTNIEIPEFAKGHNFSTYTFDSGGGNGGVKIFSANIGKDLYALIYDDQLYIAYVTAGTDEIENQFVGCIV